MEPTFARVKLRGYGHNGQSDLIFGKEGLLYPIFDIDIVSNDLIFGR